MASVTWVAIEDRLQGQVCIPNQFNGWCAVLTHPHPKLGGDLDNNVVVSVSRALEQLGIATIRFNTRGVGQSLGSSTWRGVDEREDVKAAINFAWTLPNVKKVALVAYSFGAAVGLSVSAEMAAAKKLNAVVALGYPKGFIASFVFSAHYSLVDPKSDIPKLFVLGDSDDFTSVSTMKSIYNKISEPKELVIVSKMNHFCLGQENLITEPVVNFFQTKVLGKI